MKNMKKKKFVGILASLAVVVASIFCVTPALAYKYYCPDGTSVEINGSIDIGTACDAYKEHANENNLMGTATGVINVIIGIVGFIAVVMIIIGGISYSTSAGDAGKVKKAKDTIMYGIIGLVVAVLAFAIVNFVLSNIQ